MLTLVITMILCLRLLLVLVQNAQHDVYDILQGDMWHAQDLFGSLLVAHPPFLT
jgi:hypothetical protein